MREKFIEKVFRDSSMRVIVQAELIIEEYKAQGFILTLRQLYYQFVARAWLGNTIRNYKRLGAIISDARLAGLIDWKAIEDRTRKLSPQPHWDSPADVIEAARRGYRLSRWESQENYVEVWVEKEALAGVIERICKQLDVPFFACRGYVSQSEQYTAGKRLERHAGEGQQVTVFHLGDHDPSGIDMTRDNRDRLNLFSYQHPDFELKRIALNMDQVEEHSPPPNPAKTTDSRYQAYIDRYGDESWELDALDPQALEGVIAAAVNPLIDRDEWAEVETRERNEKALLLEASNRWDEVAEFLQSEEDDSDLPS